MNEPEYELRLIELHRKAASIGVSFEHDLRGCKYLQDFWYGGNDIATIEYKGYTICFDVVGEVFVSLYDNTGKVETFKRKSGAAPFIENSEVLELLADDDTLLEEIKNHRVMFDMNNWINIAIVCNATGEYIGEPEVAGETNLLETIENAFDTYIGYIDEIIKDVN